MVNTQCCSNFWCISLDFKTAGAAPSVVANTGDLGKPTRRFVEAPHEGSVAGITAPSLGETIASALLFSCRRPVPPGLFRLVGSRIRDTAPSVTVGGSSSAPILWSSPRRTMRRRHALRRRPICPIARAGVRHGMITTIAGAGALDSATTDAKTCWYHVRRWRRPLRRSMGPLSRRRRRTHRAISRDKLSAVFALLLLPANAAGEGLGRLCNAALFVVCSRSVRPHLLSQCLGRGGYSHCRIRWSGSDLQALSSWDRQSAALIHIRRSDTRMLWHCDGRTCDSRACPTRSRQRHTAMHNLWRNYHWSCSHSCCPKDWSHTGWRELRRTTGIRLRRDI